ncbi:MAG: AzlC family ABC transporter permease [Anaerolineae bacterium]|nr:AzlC family ABC transporter permease [Anaerolineae bacterium]
MHGFRAVLPLWLGAAPFALAYAVAAQQAGWHPLEIQLMSLTVYSAPAQLSAVQMVAGGLPMISAIMTAVAVNLHQALYGVSLAHRMRFSRAERIISVYLLTDAAYGVSIAAETQANAYFLLGAEVSLFLVWNVSTLAGLLVGQVIDVPAWLHVEFVSPLMFLMLLISMLKAKRDVMVALLALVLTLICFAIGIGSLTVLVVGISAALIGAWLTKPLVAQP